MTENKRYFKRMWEEEFYIFDSETISEKEFDDKVEYEDYRAFESSLTGDEVVNRLNELNDENKQLRFDFKEMKDLLHTLEKENKELKYQNELLSDELEQCKVVINKEWSKYLAKKELENE